MGAVLPRMPAALATAARKWNRDASLPLSARIYKAAEYSHALLAAPWWLRNVNSCGHSVRVLGKPRIENHGRITLGNDVLLRSVTIPLELYTTHGAEIVVGSGCVINSGSSLAATARIVLGDRVFLGGLVFIMDNNFHDVEDRDVHPDGQPVILEDDVWIGAKATVMPGVRIGRGSVVGAHSVVTRDVAPYSLVAGAPARMVRSIREGAPGQHHPSMQVERG